ncbi:MAG: deoxyribonuclease IV [Epulopiscium sp. Nele67-Bin004]|nr:MAG: deoxyribonuclease IV [Epulopiscium sp. Nele67-Bin004]
MLKLGCHVSMSSGLLGAAKEAHSYGANTFMIYTGAPQNTRRSPLEKLKIPEGLQFMKEHNLEDIVVHAPYIINMASCKPDLYQLAKDFLTLELERTKALSSNYLVLHPGAFTTSNLDEGIDRIIAGLNEVLKDDLPIICLETMAGKGSEIGRNFDELRRIIEGVNLKNKIGVCLDTCHMHDSGLDIVDNFEGVLDDFDKTVGNDYIKVLHINGSLNVRGAKKDRHANIGADVDNIGKDAIFNIVHNPVFKDKPLILETPWIDKTTNLYKEEISFLRG